MLVFEPFFVVEYSKMARNMWDKSPCDGYPQKPNLTCEAMVHFTIEYHIHLKHDMYTYMYGNDIC